MAILRADSDLAYSYPECKHQLKLAFQHLYSEVETTWSELVLRVAFYKGLVNRMKVSHLLLTAYIQLGHKHDHSICGFRSSW